MRDEATFAPSRLHHGNSRLSFFNHYRSVPWADRRWRSILTVPVLVYLFSVDAVAATAYSLFIVGLTSAVGSVSYFKKGLVNVKTAVIFGIPSIIAVFMTRAYIVPAIPTELFKVGNMVATKSHMLMLLFAVIMIAASYSMIRKAKAPGTESTGSATF